MKFWWLFSSTFILSHLDGKIRLRICSDQPQSTRPVASSQTDEIEQLKPLLDVTDKLPQLAFGRCLNAWHDYCTNNHANPIGRRKAEASMCLCTTESVG